MEAILAFFSSKLAGIGIGAGGALLIFGLGKFLPKYAGKMVAQLLGRGLKEIGEVKDPVEKKLIEDVALAVVKWAEYKIPDKGQGKARYDAAAKKLVALLPFLKGKEDAISDIIEAAVAAMDSELKKAEQPK